MVIRLSTGDRLSTGSFTLQMLIKSQFWLKILTLINTLAIKYT